MAYGNMINESTGSSNRLLSDKTMTLTKLNTDVIPSFLGEENPTFIVHIYIYIGCPEFKAYVLHREIP
jgi:hypothetical protein